MAKNIDNASTPLKDVVLCSTSLPQDARSRLAEVAAQMGAVHKLDLTGDVTHLVVGDIDTPKYKYVAKERPDICVLHPDWIEAMRAAWMEGGDEIDVRGLEREHRFPTFAGLKICMTGITDFEERSHIENTIKRNGAEYHGDLTRDITHLIVAKPEGAKYRAAKDWGGIKTVSIKWFHDCLTRGMLLEAGFYDPNTPVEDQGIGAFRAEPRTRTSLGKRLREEEVPAAAVNDGGKRKLRRTASKKLESHSQDMWQNIHVRDSILPQPENDQWSAANEESQATLGREETAQDAKEPGTVAQAGANVPSARPEGLFSGWHIFIDGFEKDRAKRLAQYLEPSGATVVSRIQDLANATSDPHFRNRCLLVPHAKPHHPVSLNSAPAATIIATEWWVERCVHQKSIADPERDVLSRPLWDLPLPDFSGLVVSTTGFTGVDFRQTGEAIKMSGATYQDNILPTTSVLISGSSSVRKEKAFYATKHSIPVVGVEWLWACFRKKCRVAVDKYRLELPAFDPKESIGEPSTSSPAPTDVARSATGPSRKDATAPSRLSNSRKRSATPALLLQKTASAPRTLPKAKGQPFVHEDDDAEDESTTMVDADLPAPIQTDHRSLSPRQSKPLQNISPNASPSKVSREAENDALSVKKGAHSPQLSAGHLKTPPEDASDLMAPAPAPATEPPKRASLDPAAELATLISHRRHNTSPAEPVQRLKSRKLGRAPSGSNLMSRSLSGSTGAPADDGDDGEERRGAQQPELPSTQLGYEAPEAEQARAQMAKRMGTSFSDDTVGRRVERVGMVKDATSSNAGGSGARAAKSRPKR